MTGRDVRLRTGVEPGQLLSGEAGALECNVVVAHVSELLSLPDERLHGLRATDRNFSLYVEERLTKPLGDGQAGSLVKALASYHGPAVGVAAGPQWAALAPVAIALGFTREAVV